MAGYGQFCPLAQGAEVFAERWTPLVLRELMAGSHRFSELQRGLPRMSRALLAERLANLASYGIVERRAIPGRRGFSYHLTRSGEELRPVVGALGAWGYRWMGQNVRREHLDPDFLMWVVRRRIRVDRLPARRVVVRVEVRGRGGKTFWLVLERPTVDLCLVDHDFDVDLDVSADTTTLTRIYLGRLDPLEAMRCGLMTVVGTRDLVRGFPTWLGETPFKRLAASYLRGRGSSSPTAATA